MQRPLLTIAVTAALCLAFAPDSNAADPRITTCGSVQSYTPATAAAPGSIVIGTQTLSLAAGSAVSVVNPPIETGVAGCFTGSRSAAGSYTEYGLTPLPASFCGVVSSFTAPSGASAGSITLGSSATVTFAIPSGTTVAATIGGASQCYSINVAASGDAIVVGNAGVPQVGVAVSPASSIAPSTIAAAPSAAATAASSVTTLPSTSTSTTPNWWLLFALVSALAAFVVTRWSTRRQPR